MQQFLKHETYSRDMENEIMLWLDYDSIYIQCKKNKQLKIRYFDNERFWITKAKLDFNVSPTMFKNTLLSPHERYLQLLTYNNHVALKSYQFTNIKHFIKLAILTKKDYLLDDPDLRLNQQLYDKIVYYFVKLDDVKNVQKWIQYLYIKRDFSRFYPVRTLKMLRILNFYIHDYTEILKEKSKIIKYADLETLKFIFQDVDVIEPFFIRPGFVSQINRRPDKEIFEYMITKIGPLDEYINLALRELYTTADHDYINFVLDYYKQRGINTYINYASLFVSISSSKNFIYFSTMFDKIKNEEINFGEYIISMAENSTLQIIAYILNHVEFLDRVSINYIVTSSISRYDVKDTLEYVFNKYGKTWVLADFIFNVIVEKMNIDELIESISVLKKYGYYLTARLTKQFLNAINIKDKYYMDVIFNYAVDLYNKRGYQAFNMKIIKNKSLTVKDIRIRDYLNILFSVPPYKFE